MKATIKLFKNQREAVNGFPIYLELSHYESGKRKRKRKLLGYSTAQNWDFKKNIPLNTHPEYDFLLPEILNLKAKILKLTYGSWTWQRAVLHLFNSDIKLTTVFVDACWRFIEPTRNGELYKTVLTSFDAFYPNILIMDITPEKVKKYMQALLITNKPNGVHTYMRTLNALFNKVSDKQNPFKGIRPKKTKTDSKALNHTDLQKLIYTQSIRHKLDHKNTIETANYYKYYWLLQFYLGGIDLVDLASLRYDKHVVNGRIQFNRNKGGTNAFINNVIPPPAWELLSKFDCQPYLVPIANYNFKRLTDFVGNMNNRLNDRLQDLELSRRILTKGARYSFINRAQQLLIDERITMEIVGHTQQRIHSIYTDEFTEAVRDAAHLKIIEVTS